jgi:hypothetical protein
MDPPVLLKRPLLYTPHTEEALHEDILVLSRRHKQYQPKPLERCFAPHQGPWSFMTTQSPLLQAQPAQRLAYFTHLAVLGDLFDTPLDDLYLTWGSFDAEGSFVPPSFSPDPHPSVRSIAQPPVVPRLDALNAAIATWHGKQPFLSNANVAWLANPQHPMRTSWRGLYQSKSSAHDLMQTAQSLADSLP